MTRERLSKALLTAVLGALWVAGISTHALAHAAYKESRPADDSTVSTPPGEVWAEFTEPLADGSYLQVTDPCGARVDNGDVSIFGKEMTVSMSGAAAGTYIVNFKAFSSLDPHVTVGEFTFTAGSGESCPGDEPEPQEEEQSGNEAGDGGANQPSSATAPNQDHAGSTHASTGSGGDARSGSGGEPGDKPHPNKRDPKPRGSTQDAELAAAPAPVTAAPVWDGIPLGAFFSGLALAALIGAAGGKIYAGIMGPRG